MIYYEKFGKDCTVYLLLLIVYCVDFPGFNFYFLSAHQLFSSIAVVTKVCLVIELFINPQDLESCVTLRKAQVEKIEATYSYLQHQSSPGSEEKLCIETSPECCLNQDLVKLIEIIKSHKREEPDYEMVLLLSMYKINVLLIIVWLESQGSEWARVSPNSCRKILVMKNSK